MMDPKVDQADQDHEEALVLQVVNVLLLLLLSKKKSVNVTHFGAKTLFLVCPGHPGDPGLGAGPSNSYPGPVGAPGDSGVRGHPGQRQINFS